MENADFISELFVDVISKYIKVSVSHFRKDYLLFIKREKGKAQCKKIMEKIECKTIVKITMTEILADKSGGKKVSHLNKEYFNDNKFLKKDLQKLCEVYDISWSKCATKKQLNDTLINVILRCDAMPTPDVLNEEQETNVCPTSPGQNPKTVSPTTTPDMQYKERGKGRGKGKGKRTKKTAVGKGKQRKMHKSGNTELSDENKDCFPICFGEFDESPNWIQCDDCNKWVHGDCVGIVTEEQWEKIGTEEFFCPFCE